MMISGENIKLSIVEPGDETFMLDWENNPKNWEVSESSGPFSLEEIREFIFSCNDLYQHKQARYIIRNLKTDVPVGTVDLFNFNPEKKTVGIGILIAQPKDRKKGLGLEALNTACAMLEQSADITQIEALVYTDNTASVRLFEKAGFVHSGNRKFKNKAAYYFIKNIS